MDYLSESKRTCNHDFETIRSRFNDNSIQLLHAALGLSSETGEFVDALKKHIFYGAPLDTVNLVEELGDLFFYIAIVSRILGVSFDEIQSKNIAKLKVRYPDKFTEFAALNRDLSKERVTLDDYQWG